MLDFFIIAELPVQIKEYVWVMLNKLNNKCVKRCEVRMRRKKERKKMCVLGLAGLLLLSCLALSGCSITEDGGMKLRDLEFTLVGDEMLTQELKVLIDERKAEEFTVMLLLNVEKPQRKRQEQTL